MVNKYQPVLAETKLYGTVQLYHTVRNIVGERKVIS